MNDERSPRLPTSCLGDVEAPGSESPLMLEERGTHKGGTISVQSANVTVPTLVMTTGSLVTISVSDPAGAITVPAQPLGAPPPGAHYFLPGVISAAGYYSAAHLASQTGAAKTYAVTIPKTAAVHMFIDSDLAVTDSMGNPVPTRTASNVVVQGTSDTSVGFNVR